MDVDLAEQGGQRCVQRQSNSAKASADDWDALSWDQFFADDYDDYTQRWRELLRRSYSALR